MFSTLQLSVTLGLGAGQQNDPRDHQCHDPLTQLEPRPLKVTVETVDTRRKLPSCASTSDIIQHSILIYFSWKSKDLPFCTFVCPLKLFSRAAIDAFASFNTNALLHTMICCLVCNSLGLVSITLLRRSSKKRLREAFNDTRVVFTCIEGATTNSKSIPECEPFRSWRSAIKWMQCWILP